MIDTLKRLWRRIAGLPCTHPAVNVAADILEGDVPGVAVKWCRKCGAYRRTFSGWPGLYRSGAEWRTPEE